MKKFIALLLVAILALGLTACGGSGDASTPDDSSAAPTEETVEVTMENWFNYFDYEPQTDVTPDDVVVYYAITLKDEVAEKCTDASVKFTVKEMQAYPCQVEYNIQMSDQKIKLLNADEFTSKYGGADLLEFTSTESGEFKKTASDVGVMLKLCSKSAMAGSISQVGTVVTWETVLFQSNEVSEAAGTLTLTK